MVRYGAPPAATGGCAGVVDWLWLASHTGLVAQHDAQQGAVDFQVAVVFDETQLPELVHEMADAGPCRADDLRQRLLADLRRDRLRGAFLAEIRQDEQRPSEP